MHGFTFSVLTRAWRWYNGCMLFLKRWLWTRIIRRVALGRGYIDPVALLARLRRFAQPSEVAEPQELLRAGVMLHARGLLNTKAIQHNLDWVWPYWVERQFDPRDVSFLPRAFSITHINLTHRNWTAVGTVDCSALPIVDPRGLVTPLFDGWSVDAWLLDGEGAPLIPSRAEAVKQVLERVDGVLRVVTRTRHNEMELVCEAAVVTPGGTPVCRIRYRAQAPESYRMAVVLRPYNPEGISLVERVELAGDDRTWWVNGKPAVTFDRAVERHFTSEYRSGDVLFRLPAGEESRTAHCRVGMATAAALFAAQAPCAQPIELSIPLADAPIEKPRVPRVRYPGWSETFRDTAEIRIPDARWKSIYDNALSTLVLLSADEVYPGPYTYKRFWFRDAAYMMHGMLCAGLDDRVARVLASFPSRQTMKGFFYSQSGEWDSNGEALWIMGQYGRYTGRRPPDAWRAAIIRGVRWIRRKRTSKKADPSHAGLLPAGFSAEHFGPNDYYYWDDFWSVAGLRAAAHMLDRLGEEAEADAAEAESRDLMACIERSVGQARARLRGPGVPASPYRRMDAGAVGNLVAAYPLRLWAAEDPRMLQTAEFLLQSCTVHGGFFQEMIHSGVNAYLTLHLAQVLLRAGDPRYTELVQAVADLASPTGQWPEAIHPHTLGGCMGDGQHGWAAAEWVLMMRSLFVREEAGRVILGSGLLQEWLEQRSRLSFGPTWTAHGPLTLEVEPRPQHVVLRWEASWRDGPSALQVSIPSVEGRSLDPDASGEVELKRL